VTDTLYLNVGVYPLPYGSTAKVFVDIYKASDFYNAPSSSSLPPVASPDASATVTVAFTGTAVSLTGLDNTKSYWLRVFNPQGYSHWFPVSWQKGNSSGAGAMQVQVPSQQGPVVAPPGPPGPTGPSGTPGSAGSSMIAGLYMEGLSFNQSAPKDAKSQFSVVISAANLASSAALVAIENLTITPTPSGLPTIVFARLLISDPTFANILQAIWTPGDSLVYVGSDGTGSNYNLPAPDSTSVTGTDLSMTGLTVDSAGGAVYALSYLVSIAP
jgi:hypothetical protein